VARKEGQVRLVGLAGPVGGNSEFRIQNAEFVSIVPALPALPALGPNRLDR